MGNYSNITQYNNKNSLPIVILLILHLLMLDYKRPLIYYLSWIIFYKFI